MQDVIATFRNGGFDLAEPVDWPDGIKVIIHPVTAPDNEERRMELPVTSWPDGFFEQLRKEWGDEPFERAQQGESEVREDW